MAGPLDTGQKIATYLLLHLIPIVIYQLVFFPIPKDPMLLRILAKTLVKQAAWHLRGHPRGARPKKTKCFKKPKKKLISEDQEIQDMTIKNKLPTYLVPALFATLKVGCCIEAKLRHFLHLLQRASRFLALQSASLDNPAVRLDLDSFSIGINNHASRCMANAPHLFEDLHLTNNAGEVNEIGNGLTIKGKGIFKFSNLHLTNNAGEVNEIGNGLTIKGKGIFKFSIKDDNGKIHTIKIPNSLYLPGLKQCLLLPQHWVQEAGDGQTWMGNFERKCVLNWHSGGKKTVFFDPSTNTPIFTMAPLSCTYRAFATTFEALEAPYYRKETVLQYPSRHLMDDKPAFAPEEFIAEENLNFEKEVSFNEGVESDNETVKTSNLSAPPEEEIPSEAICCGPLTFDPFTSTGRGRGRSSRCR